MMHQHDHGGAHDGPADQEAKPWYMTPLALVCLGLAGFAGFYYLWTDHNQHVLALLPFALFLLCPLMHLFGHGHHGHQQDGTGSDAKRTAR